MFTAFVPHRVAGAGAASRAAPRQGCAQEGADGPREVPAARGGRRRPDGGGLGRVRARLRPASSVQTFHQVVHRYR